jgi:cytochrome P450
MLGVPQNRLQEFVHLGDLLFSAPHYPEEALRGANQMYEFFLEQVRLRKTDPKKDLVTYLLSVRRDGERAMTDEAIAVTARFILPGGIDTTWRGLSLMLMSLLSHEEQYREVCAEPKLFVRKAVEEGLRYSPSGFVTPRIATADREVGGVEIPAGSHITHFQGVANRDPRRWENPDRFDIHRKFKTHRTFNSGIHSCAGQHLARLEMVTCLELLAERMPNLRLGLPIEQLEVRGLMVRSPTAIPVKLEN